MNAALTPAKLRRLIEEARRAHAVRVRVRTPDGLDLVVEFSAPGGALKSPEDAAFDGWQDEQAE